MRGFDYRIQRNKDMLRGRVVSVAQSGTGSFPYVSVRMSDGRLNRFVKVLLPTPESPLPDVGELVLLTRMGGRWVVDLR